MEIFASNLRQRIADLGLSHAEVARRCDLDTRRFHHYVKGDREPDLRTLVHIAATLDTTPNILLGVETSDEPSDEDAVLRSQLVATIRMLDRPALKLLTLMADGVIAFTRGPSAKNE